MLQLARESEIKRTTVYSLLEGLIQKGLISQEVGGARKRYTAEDPDKLIELLKHRQESLQEILPELSALQSLHGGESLIKYYQGLESIKGVYEGLIKDVRPGNDYFVISDQAQWLKHDPKFFEDFSRRRGRLDVNIRLLLVNNATSCAYQKRERELNVKIKLLPKGTTLRTNLVVTPQKVVIHQLIPPLFALVIENKSIIQMQSEYFKILWERI